MDRKDARIKFAQEFGKNGIAYCQSCGRRLHLNYSVFAHKIPRGRMAGNEPERGLNTCWMCEFFVERGPCVHAARQVYLESKADFTNGELVQWGDLKPLLMEYFAKEHGVNPATLRLA